jgi:hypothetical protein
VEDFSNKMYSADFPTKVIKPKEEIYKSATVSRGGIHKEKKSIG